VISIPLVFSTGQGSEFGQRMGVVMFGGIVFSAILTFFLVPAAFFLFEKNRSDTSTRRKLEIDEACARHRVGAMAVGCEPEPDVIPAAEIETGTLVTRAVWSTPCPPPRSRRAPRPMPRERPSAWLPAPRSSRRGNPRTRSTRFRRLTMATYTATIEWTRRDSVFTDNKYSRAHTWRFDGGHLRRVELAASGAAAALRSRRSRP